MRFRQTPIFLLIAGMLAIGLTAPAHAQLPSGMQQISGTYTDPSVGLQITLPSGWSGFKTTSSTGSMAMASSGGLTSANMADSAVMVISVTDKKPINSTFNNPSPTSTNTQASNCTSTAVQKTTINGMSAVEITGQCAGDSPFKGKGYTFQTATKNIGIFFGSKSASNFDSNVGQFDSAISTLKIDNTVDVAVPVPEFPLAAVIGISAVVGVIAIIGRTRIFRTPTP